MSTEVIERKSNSLVSTNGELALNGSKRHQLQTALEYLTELQTQLSDEVEEMERLTENIKKISLKIKASPLVMQLKQSKKDLNRTRKYITEIASRRQGALGLCKKQGLEIKKYLKTAIMIENE